MAIRLNDVCDGVMYNSICETYKIFCSMPSDLMHELWNEDFRYIQTVHASDLEPPGEIKHYILDYFCSTLSVVFKYLELDFLQTIVICEDSSYMEEVSGQLEEIISGKDTVKINLNYCHDNSFLLNAAKRHAKTDTLLLLKRSNSRGYDIHPTNDPMRLIEQQWKRYRV